MLSASRIRRAVARARRRRRWIQALRWVLAGAVVAASVWWLGVLWTVLGVFLAIALLVAAAIGWYALTLWPLSRRSPHRHEANDLYNLVKLTCKRGERARALELLAELHQLAVRYPTEPTVAMLVMTAATSVRSRSMSPELRTGLLDDAERALDVCGPGRVPGTIGRAMLLCLAAMRDAGDDDFQARRAALEDRLVDRAPYLREVRTLLRRKP